MSGEKYEGSQNAKWVGDHGKWKIRFSMWLRARGLSVEFQNNWWGGKPGKLLGGELRSPEKLHSIWEKQAYKILNQWFNKILLKWSSIISVMAHEITVNAAVKLWIWSFKFVHVWNGLPASRDQAIGSASKMLITSAIFRLTSYNQSYLWEQNDFYHIEAAADQVSG